MIYQVMPDLTPIEYEGLKASIAEAGVLVPVEVDEDGNILDGHHRVRAWTELQTEGLHIAEYKRIIRPGMTEEQKRNHARVLNVQRRHLSKEQQEAVMQAMRADRMSIRQIAEATGSTIGTVHRAVSGVPTGTPVTGKDGKTYPAKQKPAKPKPKTPGLFVEDTKQQDKLMTTLADVKEHAPDLLSAVSNGEIKPTAANREVKHRKMQKAPPMPTGKYRVFYADPPWQYGNSGVITGDDNYGRAERHYPSMSIDELCAMGADVRAMAEDNAVLFMWVTSPLLAECFPVIDAFGFQYKTSFVWDKVRHNFGHYNSVRHELLLVCTRGSCLPDDKTLYDSVVSVERSDKHSEKPEEFRRMIDSLYTWGGRIELFARSKVDGWDTWGNET